MPEQPCPKCDGRGVYIKDNNTACVCACAGKARIKSLANSSHMTEALRKKCFQNFSLNYYSRSQKDPYNETTHYDLAMRALEACKAFIRDYLNGNNPMGLYIHGQVGSGKTHLACGIANELIKMGVEVLFVVVPDYLDEIKYSWDEGSSSREKEILDRAREVSVLVMDDLGAHSYSDWTKNKIYTILNHRINNNLPTIITSNLEYLEIGSYLDNRISSRITELCRPVLILVDKYDIRFKKLIENN
ncbi:MAG: ATP-binding protein [Bacillota bacterium]